MNKFNEAINYVNYMNETYLEHTKKRSGQTGFGQWPHLVKKALERGKKLEELVKLYRYLNENTNDYDLDEQQIDDLQKQIEELEREIEK